MSGLSEWTDFQIFKKALNRAKTAKINSDDPYEVIVFLEKEIDRYRDKIKSLEETVEYGKRQLDEHCNQAVSLAQAFSEPWYVCDFETDENGVKRLVAERVTHLDNDKEENK